MADLLSTAQLAELRARWVFDRVDAAAVPPVYLSVYNKRFSRQFFADADLQVMARRARKRWGGAIGDGVAQSYAEVIHSSGGGGFAAQPENQAIAVVSSEPADVGMQVTLYGTTYGTGIVVKETVTLNGATPVSTVKTDWGTLLAAVNVVTPYDVVGTITPAGTVSISTADGHLITTLDSVSTSRGFQTAGQLIAGLPITAMVGSVIPEVGLKVYDDDVTVQADAGTTAEVGFVGIGPDGAELLGSITLRGIEPVVPGVGLARLDAVLTGAVAEGLTVTVLARDIGPYEGEEVLFAGIQVLAFETYLGSDEYASALEDTTRADQVRKAWETRIQSDLKKLAPRNQRGGFADIVR
jgi:hypothetical protein